MRPKRGRGRVWWSRRRKKGHTYGPYRRLTWRFWKPHSTYRWRDIAHIRMAVISTATAPGAGSRTVFIAGVNEHGERVEEALDVPSDGTPVTSAHVYQRMLDPEDVA